MDGYVFETYAGLSSAELIEAEASEAHYGHRWKRDGNGAIIVFNLVERCAGPTCDICGFSYCVSCGYPPAERTACGAAVVETEPTVIGAA